MQGIDATLKEAGKPDITAKPCKQGEDHRNSDLCAQWYAADAATSAALAAWLIGAVGIFIAGVTMVAAIIAARWARKAAVETEKGANAALEAVNETREANRIAREAAEKQLMPYVYIERIEPTKLDPADPFIYIKLKNFGQTPATNVKTAATFRRCKTGEAGFSKTPLNDVEAQADIPPLHTQTIRCPVEVEDWPRTVDQIMAESIVLVVRVRVGYTGLGASHVWRDLKIIFDHMGPRQPKPGDNLMAADT